MAYVFPAMVTEPLRAAPVLAVTDTVTVVLSVPLVGDKVTQERLSDVVQEQLEPEAVTETDLLPLSFVKLPLEDEML